MDDKSDDIYQMISTKTAIRKINFMVIIFVYARVLLQAQEPVRVISFDVSECIPETLMENIRTRIVERTFVNQILTVKLGLMETCCVTFTPSINYLGKSNSLDTLNLDYRSGADECECNCYYEFTYKIKGVRNANVSILFKGKLVELSKEKYLTFPVKYRLLGRDTVNFVDKYGMRQGLWTFDTVKIRKYNFFKDDVNIKEIVLFDNGKVHKAMKREFGNWNYFIEYFESGVTKVECYNDEVGGSYKEGRCKEWSEKGELIYEGPFKRVQRNN